ncbi:lipin Ned1 [Coemansia sp. RSA 2050]|nr:lipin Ned1 [Coemansia sp. RSA 2050]KAJ2730707.1 lipin Ned1 [Coemansia sp. BCRC 34962]
MQYVGKVFSTVSQLYKELNPATLSGAIDVVVVEGRDGEFSCSPFHVRFGKLQLLRPSDKAVQVIVNDIPADFYMKVGDAGEGFFVLETEADVPSQFATSPVASPSLSFRNAEDPDFLDLGGNIKTDNDGYVSAPSAHESESGDEAVPDLATGISSSFPEAAQGGSRTSLSLAFTDDMALDIRHRERILHQLDTSSASPRPRASTLRDNSDAAVADLPARGPRHRRLHSAVSDSAYVLDSFAEARDDKAAGGIVIGSDGGDDNGSADDTGPDGLHTSWDWGVKLVPDVTATTLLTPVPVPVSATAPVDNRAGVTLPTMTAVDVPLLVRLAAAHLESPESTPNTLEMSLCGAEALRASSADGLTQEHVFVSALVQQAAFQADPIGIMTNPDLVFRVGSSTFVHGEALVLSLVSHLAFGQPLSESALCQFSAIQSLPKLEPTAVVAETAAEEHTAIAIPTADQQDPKVAATTAATSAAAAAAAMTPKPETRRWWRWGQRSASTQATTQVSTISAVATRSSTTTATTITTTVDTVSIAPPRPDYSTETDADAMTLDLMSLGDEGGVGYMSDDGKLAHPMARRNVRYAKTLRLSSAQLKSLNLRRGANDVKFLVPSNKAYCEARIYLYRYDTQIVISDIDGTITKSDALGHLFNMVGKDWTHPGVAKLYTDIANNGYEILYLTSRAIGQADGTRYFIGNVKQSAYTLPPGPLLLSPDRLFTSFHREVIMKRPHEFKMACLRDIRNLFGDHSPFYAGFGNRITDAMSYRSVNVPVSRICTIDSYGEIKLDLLPGYSSSYVKINDLVDMMFPALSSKLDPKYNDWEYWRHGLPSIDDDLAEIEAELAREAAATAAAASALLATTSTPVGKSPGTATSHRLPPNALVSAGTAAAATTTSAVATPQSSSLFTRAARAMSNAGTPSATASPLPPSSPGLLGLPALTTSSRQRADSWSTTAPPPQPLLPAQEPSSLASASTMDQVFPALSSSPPADSDDQQLVSVVPKDGSDSDTPDNSSDIDVEDEDDDELDQDMLAIMHDMDEVQRLQ